jgi:hypothetical protein
MNKLLYMMIISIISSTAIYAELSTEHREEFARVAGNDDAYLTSRAEEIERTQNINDAYLTGKEEELERTLPNDDAAETSRLERADNWDD